MNKLAENEMWAFVEGMREILDEGLLEIFTSEEVQLVISGGTRGFEIQDLRGNAIYQGYKKEEPYLKAFWSILEELDDEHRGKFLRFCTGCSRPPLLGFKYLNPNFCIAKENANGPRLMSAATCVNMIRLPYFPDGNE